MATVSAPNRSIIAWLFIVGGALQIIGAIVQATNSGNWGAIYAISNIPIGVAFVLMALWLGTSTIARVAYVIAAVGWLLLALTSLITIPITGTLGLIIAAVGSIFAGVVVYTGKVFSIRASVTFLVAMILGAVELLASQIPGFPGFFETLLVILFGAALIGAGFLSLRSR
jgi:hypothetical protein